MCWLHELCCVGCAAYLLLWLWLRLSFTPALFLARLQLCPALPCSLPPPLPTHPQVVGLHKERYVFPLSLVVTKVTGTGADAIFMGVLKPQADDESSVKAWIMPGEEEHMSIVWCSSNSSPAHCCLRGWCLSG